MLSDVSLREYFWFYETAFHIEFVSQSLNELLETADAPFEVITGFIQTISLTVPWAALVQENCALEVKGLAMVFRPRPRVGKNSVGMFYYGSKNMDVFLTLRMLISFSHLGFMFSIWQ